MRDGERDIMEKIFNYDNLTDLSIYILEGMIATVKEKGYEVISYSIFHDSITLEIKKKKPRELGVQEYSVAVDPKLKLVRK